MNFNVLLHDLLDEYRVATVTTIRADLNRNKLRLRGGGNTPPPKKKKKIWRAKLAVFCHPPASLANCYMRYFPQPGACSQAVNCLLSAANDRRDVCIMCKGKRNMHEIIDSKKKLGLRQCLARPKFLFSTCALCAFDLTRYEFN